MKIKDINAQLDLYIRNKLDSTSLKNLKREYYYYELGNFIYGLTYSQYKRIDTDGSTYWELDPVVFVLQKDVEDFLVCDFNFKQKHIFDRYRTLTQFWKHLAIEPSSLVYSGKSIDTSIFRIYNLEDVQKVGDVFCKYLTEDFRNYTASFNSIEKLDNILSKNVSKKMIISVNSSDLHLRTLVVAFLTKNPTFLNLADKLVPLIIDSPDFRFNEEWRIVAQNALRKMGLKGW